MEEEKWREKYDFSLFGWRGGRREKKIGWMKFLFGSTNLVIIPNWKENKREWYWEEKYKITPLLFYPSNFVYKDIIVIHFPSFHIFILYGLYKTNMVENINIFYYPIFEFCML